MDGYIKLHRKTLENPVVCKDADYFSVWLYLLLNATHKEMPVLFQGKKITLQPGQLITGRYTIASQFSISDSKVKRILIAFENDRQIDRQRSNQNSLITVLNWAQYQQCDRQDGQLVSDNCPTTDRQLTTNKNDKNVKNDKNERINKDNIPTKHKYGEYQHVLLTDEELDKLKVKYGTSMADKCITHLDEYIEMKGYKAKSHYLCIQKWVVDAVTKKQPQNYKKAVEEWGNE